MRFRVLFLMLALLLGACGGASTDDADDSADTDDQATTTTATVNDEDDDDTTESTGTGENTGLPSGECLSIGVALSQAASMGMLGQGSDPTDAADGLAAMAGAAPAEIADDFEVMAEAFSAFAAALEDAGVDFTDQSSLSSPEAQSALAAAGEAFSSADVEEASENISQYMDEVCEG